MALRNKTNRDLLGPDDYNYACLLEDKFVFSQFGASLGHRVPRNLAFLTPTTVEWLGPGRFKEPIETLWREGVELDAFCKPVAGGQGKGVFSLYASSGRVEAGGREVTPPELASMLLGRSLLQERLEQHPAVASLHPRSLNTVRLVTVADGEEIVPLFATMRIGTGGMFVDNFSAGAISVKLDLGTGRLKGPGLSKKGSAAWAHPDSGIAFEGFPVPHFEAILAESARFHQDLRGFHSVGWDVAITTDGVSFIEGNEKWSGMPLLLHEAPAMARYLAMCGEHPAPHRHQWARRI